MMISRTFNANSMHARGAADPTGRQRQRGDQQPASSARRAGQQLCVTGLTSRPDYGKLADPGHYRGENRATNRARSTSRQSKNLMPTRYHERTTRLLQQMSGTYLGRELIELLLRSTRQQA
jgi:hypothetical protein